MPYQRRRILRPVPKNCPFCADGTEPYWNDLQILKRYVSERGKIISHARTGVCSKHQHAIARSIKHARHLALLPFINRG